LKKCREAMAEQPASTMTERPAAPGIAYFPRGLMCGDAGS
jgi:hypothetical protein